MEEILNKREETFVSTARCDIRTAASLLSFFHHNNVQITSKSQLLRLALENFVDFITNTQPEHEFKSRAEALEYLQQNELVTGKERNQPTLFKKLQQENLGQADETNQHAIINDNELLQASEILKQILAKNKN